MDPRSTIIIPILLAVNFLLPNDLHAGAINCPADHALGEANRDLAGLLILARV